MEIKSIINKKIIISFTFEDLKVLINKLLDPSMQKASFWNKQRMIDSMRIVRNFKDINQIIEAEENKENGNS